MFFDVAFLASTLAYSAPGHGHFTPTHVPTSITGIRVNPELCVSLATSVQVSTFSAKWQKGMIDVKDTIMHRLTPATGADDINLFSYTKSVYVSPYGASIVGRIRPSAAEVELAGICERISYYYLCKWESAIADSEWMNGHQHHLHLRDYI